MKNRFRKTIARVVTEQSGNALILMLCFLLLGSLTLMPVLAQMGTTLKAEVKYEGKTNELFTADAGIETGLWRIKYDFMGPDYDPYDYETVWPYETDPVNHLTADVNVQNIWLPSNVTHPSVADAHALVNSEKLVIAGTAGASTADPYHIKIDFSPHVGDNLTIKSIGIWMPQGFTYVPGSCSLLSDALPENRPDSTTNQTRPGGQTIVWSYNTPLPLFTTYPHVDPQVLPLSADITFTYTSPAGNPTSRTPRAVAWVTTEMHDQYGNTVANDVPLAWDTDMRYYKITSTSGHTDVETYSSKALLRNVNSAIAGDYVAIGNSLMTGGSSPDYIKTTLLSSSSTNVSQVSAIPADADVIASYLYWSAFRYDISKWSDNGTDFTNWNRASQIRVPISDNDTVGTWNTAPCWDDVDETSADDADYMTGNVSSNGNYYKMFGFSNFTVPAGSTITDITVYFRAKDYTSGSNNLQGCVKIGSSNTTGGSVDPGTAWATYSYILTENPKTSDDWLIADINGTGANPLLEFGVYSTDLNPAVQVSMVYAEVNYSLWTINSNQFSGQGSSNTSIALRTLTLKNSIDLSSYPSGTVSVGWKQSKSGTLEANDTLYFAVSGDDGVTWSTNNVSLQGNGSVTSPYYYVIPDEYKTGNFKIRFYFNFDATSEYILLDEINIYYMPPDNAVTFKINNQQVYLDANNDPQSGNQSLTASFSATLVAPNVGTDTPGYFYACYRDVSRLVKTYPVVPGETHHPGNANYTVGDVSGNTSEYVSYAGWSLIIIYGSPKTAGHYLYLWDIHDIFTSCPQNSYLDFDHNGLAGGDITGFVFPEPLRDKNGNITDNVSARLTCFVTEGDSYTGDTLLVTGQQSGNSRYMSNDPTDPSNNVWNSQSIGMSNQGVDVDTFVIYWTASGNIFTPGDTKVNLDMRTGQDVWNLVYIIMSVRSETDTRGTGHYSINSN